VRPGRKRAIADFIAANGDRAYRAAYRLCGRADDAGDLVQESFCRVLAGWDRYDPARPLGTWFFTILRNTYLDSRKEHGRRFAVSLYAPGSGGETYLELLPAADEPVLARLEREETIRFVRESLKRLKRRHRTVLTLWHLRGMTYQGVAETLDLPVGTVRSRISRAREAFRREAARWMRG